MSEKTRLITFLESVDMVRYDLKNEIQDFADENHQIIKFLKYKIHKGSDCDSSILATDLYKQLWEVDIEKNPMVQGDTMNSFWTTYKFSLKLLIGKLANEDIDNAAHKDLICKFKDLFLAEKDESNEEIEKQKLNNAQIKILIGNYEKIEKLLEERFKDDECIIRILENLKEFAALTHTIGNFTLVPRGYNVGRYSSTRDYWDLTLESLKVFLGNNAFEEIVHRYHFEDYVVKNETDIRVNPLFSGHSFENILSNEKYYFLSQSQSENSTILNDLLESLFEQKCKDLDECLVSINERIVSRGKKLVDILNGKEVTFEIASAYKKVEEDTVFQKIVEMLEQLKEQGKSYDDLKVYGKDSEKKGEIKKQLKNPELRSLMNEAVLKAFFEGEKVKKIHINQLAEFTAGLDLLPKNKSDIENS